MLIRSSPFLSGFRCQTSEFFSLVLCEEERMTNDSQGQRSKDQRQTFGQLGQISPCSVSEVMSRSHLSKTIQVLFCSCKGKSISHFCMYDIFTLESRESRWCFILPFGSSTFEFGVYLHLTIISHDLLLF